MGFDQDSALVRARRDLAERLGIAEGEVLISSISGREFPDMSLGAPVKGEMSAQMIANGWQINLGAGGKTYEYRADKYQIRLKDFNGKNHLVAG